ncbi:MAG: universal stress protein [Armatimonadota bacterium]
MIKKILLATDGSASSLKAAQYALQLAGQTKASVTILTAGPVPIMDLMNYHPSMAEDDILPKQVEERIKQAGEKAIDNTLEVFKGSKIKVDTHFEYGHPAEAIASYAANNGYDLIIIGNRGLSEIKSLFLGSISDRVLHIAHCPVLVVK